MIQFYKPNAKVTGSACSFWMNKDGSIMSSLIKQDSWDDKKKVGSFVKNKTNPKGRVIVKLNAVEAGGLMDAIESNREFSNYHSSQNQVLQIRFKPYERNGDLVGFSFSVNKQDKTDTTNKASFIIGFTYPEARYLKQYLSFVLDYDFSRKTTEFFESKPEEAPARPVTDTEDENSDDDFEW